MIQYNDSTSGWSRLATTQSMAITINAFVACECALAKVSVHYYSLYSCYMATACCREKLMAWSVCLCLLLLCASYNGASSKEKAKPPLSCRMEEGAQSGMYPSTHQGAEVCRITHLCSPTVLELRAHSLWMQPYIRMCMSLEWEVTCKISKFKARDRYFHHCFLVELPSQVGSLGRKSCQDNKLS